MAEELDSTRGAACSKIEEVKCNALACGESVSSVAGKYARNRELIAAQIDDLA